jgi:hypothetical protein
VEVDSIEAKDKLDISEKLVVELQGGSEHGSPVHFQIQIQEIKRDCRKTPETNSFKATVRMTTQQGRYREDISVSQINQARLS